MSSGSLLNVIRCGDTRRIMASALDQGWEWVGYTKSGHVEIRWPETDERVHCATTPSDRNAWKAFARQIKRASGVETWQRGNRRASRKTIARGVDPEVAASRRRHAAEAERREAARAAAEEQRRRRQLAADRAGEDDRRRREIESLMRPGYGR